MRTFFRNFWRWIVLLIAIVVIVVAAVLIKNRPVSAEEPTAPSAAEQAAFESIAQAEAEAQAAREAQGAAEAEAQAAREAQGAAEAEAQAAREAQGAAEAEALAAREALVEANAAREDAAEVAGEPVVVDAPVTETEVDSAVINLVQPLDLSMPEYAIPLPVFISSVEDWCNNLSSAERIAAMELAHGMDPGAFIEVPQETCHAFAFNADAMGVSADLPLLEGLLYHVHFVDGRIVYFAGDGSRMSDHGVATTDITIRVAATLQNEVGHDGLLCRPYWNAYAYDSLLGIATVPYGYFAENCSDIPAMYSVDPDPERIETFHMLLDVAGIDATPMGEVDGLWYFYTNLASQDVTCPEGWSCFATPNASVDATFSSFTGTVTGVQAAYMFEPSVSADVIAQYFSAQGISVISP